MPADSKAIAVVIPCFKVRDHVRGVIEGIPPAARHVVVVDDGCPEGSGEAAEATGDPRVVVVRHGENRGVGAAMVTGYRKAIELGADILVKMDGDGQMDPAHLDALVAPLADGRADYAKGNRFRDFAALRAMPRLRLFANSALSFLIKVASGYWNIMDPTNGYTAIRRETLERLDLDRLSADYFFESDMLIRLNVAGAVVAEVAMPARYGEERSSVDLGRAAATFPGRLLRGLARRILLRYYIYDFNMASVYLLLGLPLVAFGVVFGAIQWSLSAATGEPRTVGTVMLVVLPIILGFEMLLQAINIDIASVPRRPNA